MLTGRYNPVTTTATTCYLSIICLSPEILSEGQSCSIAIGLSPEKYELGKPPGWYPASIGYHAKDGG